MWHKGIVAYVTFISGPSLSRGRQELRDDLFPESRPEHISGHYLLAPIVASLRCLKGGCSISYTTWLPIQVRMAFKHLGMGDDCKCRPFL